MKYGIFDWANNRLFPTKEFKTFEDGWDYVWTVFPDEPCYDDYYILAL